MIVFLLVFFNLIVLTVKACFSKRLAFHTVRETDPFLFSFLRMIFCVVIGVLIILLVRAPEELRAERGLLLVCLLGGAGSAINVVGWLLAVKHLPLSTVVVTGTCSAILPALLCYALFGEPLSGPKMIGFALIVSAAVVMNAGKGGPVQESNRAVGIAWLTVYIASDCAVSFAQQLFKRYYSENGAAFRGVAYSVRTYNFYLFLVAAILLGVFTAVVWIGARIRRKKTGAELPPRPAPFRRPLLLVFLVAVGMFLAIYLQTTVTADYGLPAQILYPVTSGGCIVTLNIASVLVFREKPTVRMVIGSLLAIAGSLAMNFL